MTKDEVLRMALEHIEGNYTVSDEDAITAIKEALAQPEHEPYAWEFAGTIFHDRKEVFDWYERGDISDIPPLALYTTPLQRTWVGLTDDDLRQIILVAIGVAEAKLKQKNGYAEEKNT